MAIWRTHGIMKNSLIIITDQYPYGNGEITFVEPEIKQFKRHWKIGILSKGNGEYSVSNFADVPVIRCPSKNNLIDVLVKGFEIIVDPIFYKEICKAIHEGNNLWKSIRIIIPRMVNSKKITKKLLKYVQNCNENGVIIYSYWFNYSVLAAVYIKNKCKAKNVKVVTRIHGYDLYDNRSPLGYQMFQDQILDKVDKIFFTCETAKMYYQEQHPSVQLNQCVCAYMGCEKEKEQMTIQDSIFTIVSCSNLISLKRVDIIIQALGLIDDREIRWIHFGDGILKEQLIEMAERLLGNKDNIRFEFRGQVKNEQIKDFYRLGETDCFITTSQTEGMPMSIIEALSFGIPIIATDVGGIHEQIDGNGILLKSNPTVEEVGQAIIDIVDSTEKKRKEMCRKSHLIWKEKFDLEKNISKLESEFRGLL